jgi:DMSO reductase anchor subunit
MRRQDWSLVFFTSLSQWSIGITLLFTGLVYFFDDMGPVVETGLKPGNPVLLALLLVGVATTVSFLHLGNPVNAPNVLKNLAGSWLSREILAIAVYSLSVAVVLFTGWNYFLLPASAAGFALLWTMVRVYMMPTIPAWNSWFTPLSFASTTVCLGLITFLLLSMAGSTGIDQQASKFYLGILIAILVLEIVSGLLRQRRLEKMDTGIDGPTFRSGAFYKLFLARLALLLITCLAMLLLVLRGGFSSGDEYFAWMYLLLALVIIQEFLGRLLFYSSYFRTGL